MSTPDILEKARELGNMIAASEEIKALSICEKNLTMDSEAQLLLGKFNELQGKYHSAVSERDFEAQQNLQNELMTAEDELHKNNNIAAYINAKNSFEGLLGEINQIISFAINGGDDGCSSGCGSCSGCGN
jgi:cell fate (sporulation/competence/biofilm development) regulator YlbF (YheA/YmcA/DUF963 family)